MSFALLTCKVAWGDGTHIHLHFYRQASTCSAQAPSPVFAAHLTVPCPLGRKEKTSKLGPLWFHMQFGIHNTAQLKFIIFPILSLLLTQFLISHLLIKESHDSKNLCKIILPEENFQNYKVKEVIILDWELPFGDKRSNLLLFRSKRNFLHKSKLSNRPDLDQTRQRFFNWTLVTTVLLSHV